MFSPNFAWNDYFSGTPETTIGPGQYSSRQTPSVSSVYVSNCLFKCTLTSGNGGALYCTSTTYFFVESSSFISCRTNSGSGGAIYFFSSNCLQSILYSVCGYDCYSTSFVPFAYIVINNAASNKNCANYSSIVSCVNDTSISGETFRLDYGKLYCPSVNISKNICRYISGIVCSPLVDSNSVTSSLSYSTFADNNVSQYGCIWCNNYGAKYEIKCCNILRNIEISSSYGLISTYGNLVIKDSCIIENKATNYIFYLFYTSYTFTLSNCTVDSTSHNGLTIQNTVTKSFIHGLNHMSTQNCHSEYDSAGTLTAIQSAFYNCRTCKNHYQARMSDFFTSTWVLMAAFIHPNPSINC
jgi:hypothetical protein